MSNEAVGRFVDHIAGDQKAANGLVDAVETKQGDAAYEAVSAFAKGQGFDIDVDDARVLQQSILQSQDLSDSDLETIQGGAIAEAVALGVVVGGLVGIVATSAPVFATGFLAANMITNAVEGKAWNSSDNSFIRASRRFVSQW